MIDWPSFCIGDHRQPCPVCGRGPNDKTLGLTIKDDLSGVARCFRCDYVETHRAEHGTKARTPTIKSTWRVDEKHTELCEWGWNVWRSCLPISGVALEYLHHRRCVIPPADGDLRWHTALKHPCGYVGPALVALVTDILTGKTLSLHRTWITASGKAGVSPARLMLAGHQIKGGCIRLWPDEAVTYGLGIAEGIETALSLAWAYSPVWATIDAGHMAQFPVLAGLETLVIAQDQDLAGTDAAATCASRWAEADKEVLVTRQAANDLNDLLMEVA